MQSNSQENKIKKTFKVKEFASIYGIGVNKAYELVNSLNFPMIKLGKKILIIASRVDEWFESNMGKKF